MFLSSRFCLFLQQLVSQVCKFGTTAPNCLGGSLLQTKVGFDENQPNPSRLCPAVCLLWHSFTTDCKRQTLLDPGVRGYIQSALTHYCLFEQPLKVQFHWKLSWFSFILDSENKTAKMAKSCQRFKCLYVLQWRRQSLDDTQTRDVMSLTPLFESSRVRVHAGIGQLYVCSIQNPKQT